MTILYILHLQREPSPFRIRHRNIIINAAPVPGNSNILRISCVFTISSSNQKCLTFPPALINRRIEAVIVVRIVFDITKVSLSFLSAALIRIEVPGNHPLQRRGERVPPSFRQFVVHPGFAVTQQLRVQHLGVRLEMDFGDGVGVVRLAFVGISCSGGFYHKVVFDIFRAFAHCRWSIGNIDRMVVFRIVVKLNLLILARNNHFGKVHRDVAIVFIRRVIV